MKCFRKRQKRAPRLYSYFSRQLLTTVSILLLAFTLLGTFFISLFFNHVSNMNTASLRTTADAVSSLASAYSTMGDLEDIHDLRISLTFASEVSGTDAVICDDNGVIILCSCKRFPCQHLGMADEGNTLAMLPDEGMISTGRISNLYEDERYVLMQPLYSKHTNERLGTMIVSAPTGETHQLMQRLVAIFLYTALIILLLAVLLSSVLAKRETRPLKVMANAARRFARGELSVRVPPSHTTVEIAELESAFNSMATSLEQSESLRREFVANVSHELKTPMTTIAGFLDGMLDGTIPPELHPKYMRAVSDETRRLSRLVRSMLELTRLQSAQVQKVKFDICELMSRVLVTFEQKIDAKELQVDLQVPDKAVNVMGDPDKISQVVFNLLDNAVKFSTQGAPLTLAVKTSGSKANISITNIGQTIPPEEQKLIFDRFHKGDYSRGMNKDGLGLGLHLVKTILASHGEDIAVTSADGVTTFTFTMTLAK